MWTYEEEDEGERWWRRSDGTYMRRRDFLNTSVGRSHFDADISPISFDRYPRSRVRMLDRRLLVVLQQYVYRLPFPSGETGERRLSCLGR